MRKRRSLSALLAAALLLMFFGTGSVSAAGAAGGDTVMEPQVILKGDCFFAAVTLTVLLHNAGPESLGRIFIDYDGTKLIFTSCTAGPVGLIAVNSAEKRDRIFISWEGGFPASGEVLLATMVFLVATDVIAGTAAVFTPTVSRFEVEGTDLSACVTAEPLEVTLLTVPVASGNTVSVGKEPQPGALHRFSTGRGHFRSAQVRGPAGHSARTAGFPAVPEHAP